MNQHKAAIVMSTDFTHNSSVSTMHGVCMMVDPELRIFDCNHDITSFDTYEASTELSFVVPFWPAGTVFVSVVDPGVGSSRRACVAKLKNGSYVVTPDNGALTHLKASFGIVEVRVIDETKHRLKTTEKCNIFHGRDVFAYCAAKLASGIITYEEVGEAYPLDEIVTHELIPCKLEGNTFSGMINMVDRHFGLICSNIPADLFEEAGIKYGDFLDVEIYNRKEDKVYFSGKTPYVSNFTAVQEGDPLLMVSETLEIQIATHMHNMAENTGIRAGSDWLIKMTKC